jgi:hypothetical protein
MNFFYKIIGLTGLKNFFQIINRSISRPSLSWLNRDAPFSRFYGMDRGQAIDRKFIESFISKNSALISGNVLEFGDDRYMTQYGNNLERLIVVGGQGRDPRSLPLYGDLTNIDSLNHLGVFDCVIATNVINFIFDFDAAVYGLSSLVNKESGTVLVTVSGLSQISRYDYVRWGDYWRFNDKSIRIIFEKYFHEVEVQTYGNAPLAAAFIMGLAQEDVPNRLFEYIDPDYQIIITVKAAFPKKID